MSGREKGIPILLFAIAGVLVVVLALRFVFFHRDTTDLRDRVDRIGAHVSSRGDGTPITWDSFFIPRKPDLTRGEAERSDWAFNGLAFYDLHEIDRFFLEKIRETGDSFTILPPRNLYGAPVRGGIKLVWSGNPLNHETIKKLAGNPLLQLRYKIYRWIKGEQPEPAAVIPYEQEQYLDTDIAPVREEYFYCVLLILEGSSKEDRIFIESKQSDVIRVLSNDRFKIRLTGGRRDNAFVTVTITDRDDVYTESFVVARGEEIGQPKDVPGKGTLDFSTGLILKEMRSETEEKAVTTKVPEFNSDGSIKINATTRDPVYRTVTESEPVQVITIECIDRKGRVRIFKES